MADLRTFLHLIEQQAPDLFARVKAEVNPRWELSAVQMRLQAEGKLPVLFFERVSGHAMPVVSNLFASKRHLALALGTSPDRLVSAFSEAATRRLAPVEVSTGPVKDVVSTGEKAVLSALPLVTHCEKDAGPYLSSGVTIMRDPGSGALNAGLYRHRVVSDTRMTVNMAPLSHGEEICRDAEAKNVGVDAAIVIGHHPALAMASQQRGERGAFELDVMGGLLGEPVPTVRAETVDCRCQLMPRSSSKAASSRVCASRTDRLATTGCTTHRRGRRGSSTSPPSRIAGMRSFTMSSTSVPST